MAPLPPPLATPLAIYSPLSGEFAANIYFLHSQGYSPQCETSITVNVSSPFPTHVSQGGHCFSTSLQVQLYLADFHQQNANVGVVRGVIESADRHDISIQAYKSATIIAIELTALG